MDDRNNAYLNDPESGAEMDRLYEQAIWQEMIEDDFSGLF